MKSDLHFLSLASGLETYHLNIKLLFVREICLNIRYLHGSNFLRTEIVLIFLVLVLSPSTKLLNSAGK
jgi:hypothetical protein